MSFFQSTSVVNDIHGFPKLNHLCTYGIKPSGSEIFFNLMIVFTLIHLANNLDFLHLYFRWNCLIIFLSHIPAILLWCQGYTSLIKWTYNFIYVFFILSNNLCKMGLSLSWSFGKICLENYLDLVVFACLCVYLYERQKTEILNWIQFL